MKTLPLLMLGALASTGAFAASNSTASSPFTQIATHAVEIQKDAEWMSNHLKTRQIDRQQLEQHSAAVEENIAKLKQLVAAVESSPESSVTRNDTWQLMKTKVELLSIFHGKKKELLSASDLSKNRSWLRAHADGIAKRAELLQRSASQMN